ncbi:hypothetical protein K8I61_17585 [bacterium]|nr:hypothetical protein [bacterium]
MRNSIVVSFVMMFFAATLFLVAGATNTNAAGDDKATPAPGEMAEQTGWSLRVCPKNTTAEAVEIHIGRGDDKASHRFWKKWTKGEATEMTLPSDLVNAPEIWVMGKTMPPDQRTEMCVVYNAKVAKNMEFDGDDTEKIKMEDDGECGC